MLRLNIIPEHQKKEIKLKYFFDHLKNFFEVIFFVSILYVIVFLILKLILSNHFIATIESTTMLTKRTEDFSRKVSDINKRVSNVATIQEEFIYWSKLIEHIRQNQSYDLKLDQISVNKNKNEIVFSGNAETRDTLLNFKKKIEDLGFFEEIKLPIQSLLQKNDINFNLTVKIKSYDF